MVAPGCAGAAATAAAGAGAAAGACAAAAAATAAAAGVPHKGELLLTGKLRLHSPMPRLRRGTEIDLTLFYFILLALHFKPLWIVNRS